MLKLIINADDLGAGTETDRGICRAFTDGLVTSASLLANGPSAPVAARQALQLGLPAGVHLNLTEGMALTGPLAGLTAADDRFLGKQRARQVLEQGAFDAQEVCRELQAQIDLVRRWGLVPDHLDSHQHILLWPTLTKLIIDLATQNHIDALRLPAPVFTAAGAPASTLARELKRYHELAGATRRQLQEVRLRFPSGLLGMELLNRLDLPQLLDLIDRLPEDGCWELMVHPGYRDPQNPFSGPEREIELAALIDPRGHEALASRRIRLISFGELPCAS